MAKSGRNDKMVKDIRSSLKSAAKHGGRYLTGTAKLFLASGKEMLDMQMPILNPMIETNADLLKDTAKFLRNPADSIHKQFNRAMQSETYQAAKDVAKNALEDLKTGKLYDKDRMRDDWGSSIDDLLNNFGDLDMSGFNSDGDYIEPDSSTDEFDKFLDLAGAQEEAAGKRTGATIDAIGASTNAIVATENANSQANIRLSMKQHSQTMSGIQNLITVQSAQLQGMADSAKATLDLTRETHKQIMDSMAGITALLEKVVENTTPVAAPKTEYREPTNVFNNGALDVKKYLKNVAKNVDDYYGISSSVKLATGGMSAADLIRLYQDNPLQFITDRILSSIVPEKTKKAMENTNKNIESFFPALFQKLGERGIKGQSIEGDWKDVIAGFFGVKSQSNKYLDTQIKEVNGRAALTNKTITAIETVIPMWLSKIYSGISGEPLKVFNYSTGKLETAASIIAGSSHSANDLANRMGNGARTIMSRSRAYKFEDPEMEKDFQEYVYNYLQYNAENNRFINPFESSKEFKSKMPYGAKNEQLYHNLLKGIMANMPQDELMSLGSEIFGARAARDKATARLNDEMRENGQLAALMGWVDERLVDKLSDESTSKRYGLSDSGINKVLRADRDAMIKNGGIQATNVYLNDITSMLRRGILTYTYIIGGTKRNGDDTNSRVDSAVIKTVTDNAGDEAARIAGIKDLLERDDTYNAEYRRSQKERAEAEKKAQGPDTKTHEFYVNDKTTESMARAMQQSYVIDNTAENTSNNPWVEYARAEQKKNAAPGQKYTDKVIKTVQKDVDELGERMGLKGIFQLGKEVAKSPFSIFTTGLNVLDGMMFKALYGEDAVYQVDTNSVPALINSLQTYMKSNLLSMKEWFTNDIINPIREKILGPDGILGKIADKIRERIVDPAKGKINDKVKDLTGKVLGTYDKDSKTFSGGKFSDRLNSFTEGVRNFLPKTYDGPYYQDKNGRWHNRDLGGKFVKKAEAEAAIAEWEANRPLSGSETLKDRLLYGKYTDQARKGVSERTVTDISYLDDETQVRKTRKERKYSGLTGPLHYAMDAVTDLMFGSYDTTSVEGPNGTTTVDNKEIEKSKYYNKLKKEFSDAMPDMAIGGGLGVIGSLFLPGGPILGAVVGSGLGLARSSETFKHYLFGDEIDKVKTDKFGNPVLDKDGNPVKEKTRAGALISNDVYEGVRRFAPKMTKGALVGALAGGMGLLPFGMGPAIGAVFGSMGGMINASEQFQKAIWGDPADDTEEGRKKGLISKDFREKAKKALKDHLPAGVSGAAIGTALGSGLGLLPGLSLLPTGPILGVLGAMTGLSQSDRFNKFFFGDEVEKEEIVKDKDGNVVGTKKKKVREGGIFNKMFEGAKEKVLNPLATAFNNAGKAVGEWFNTQVFKPFENALEPVKDAMRSAGEALWDRVKSIGDTIMQGIQEVFEFEPKKFMKEKIWDPLNNLTKKLFSGIGTIIGKILSAPFKALEFVASGGRTIGGTPVDDLLEQWSQERAEKRRGTLKERVTDIWSGFGKKITKNANKAGDQIDAFNERMGGVSFRGKRYSKNDDGDWVDEEGNKAGMFARMELNFQQRVADRKAKRANQTPPYYQDANGRWRDSKTGKFAKTADAEKAMGIKSKAEPTSPNAPVPDTAIAGSDTVKPSTVGTTKAEGKTTEPRKNKKTDNEYLEKISKFTSKIYDEIKGQLGGTGWELKYIRTLLSKQYGALDDSELPEEMEGSKRTVKKRRGFFGRAKDAIGGFFGNAKDKIGGTVSRVFDVVLHPLRLVGKIIGGIGEGIKAAGSALLSGLKIIGEGLGQIALGFADMTKNLLIGVGKMFAGAAKGIGETLGNTVGLLSGLVKDVGLSLGALTRSVIETGAALAPEVITDVFKGTKWLVKGGINVAGKVLKLGAKGAKHVFGAIHNKFFKKKDDQATDENGNPIPSGSFSLDGGYLDYIKERVPIALSNGVAFPVVAVANGHIIGTGSTNAIPVFIMGVDRSVNAPGSNEPGTPNNPIDADHTPVDEKAEEANKLRIFKRRYFGIDNAAEKSGNMQEVYDKAIAGATTMDEIRVVETVSNLNGNKAMAAMAPSDKSKEDGGLFEKLFGAKGSVIIKAIGTGLATLLGGTALGKTITKLLGTGAEVSASASTIAGTAGQVIGAGILPSIGAAKAASEGNLGHAAVYSARGLAREGTALLKATGIAGFAAQGSTKVATNAGGRFLQKTGLSVAAGVENAGATLSSKIAQAAEKLLNNKTVASLMKKFPKAGPKIINGFKSKIDDVVLRLGASTAQELLKKLNLVVLVATAVYDFASGMSNAAQYFKVEASDVTFGLRIAAGFAKALSGIAFGLIPISWLSEFLFKIFANEEKEAELKEKQAELSGKVSNINKLNNTNLSVEDYQQYYDEEGNLKKKGGLFHLGKVYDPVSQSWVKKSEADQYKLNTGMGRGRVRSLNQTSSKYNKYSNDMSLNGCGPTAAAMVSTAYGKRGDPLAANRMSYGMGMRAADGGTDPRFFGQYAKSQGFNMAKGPNSPGMVYSNLSKGNPVVLMGKGGAFGSGMHYLVADGIDGRGNVSIKDPLGGTKHAKLDGLLSNTTDTVYSYGRGDEDEVELTNRSAQKSLVNWMKSKMGKISYSLGSTQDPDKGVASCASTVGWAYRKALGGDFETNRLSASSNEQARDSRFQTIYSKGMTPFNESILQPGDIMYVATGDDPNKITHTEMYVGNGQDLSHGGPGLGPIYRKLNNWRKNRIIKARRYNGFINGDTVTYNDASSSGGIYGDGVEQSDRTGIKGILGNALADVDDVFNTIGNKFSNIIGGIFGENTDESTDNPVDGDLKSTTNAGTLKGTTNGAKIYNFLRSKGLTKEQAAGIMGNIQAESGLRPEAVQGDYLKNNKAKYDKEYYTGVNNGSISRDAFIRNGPGGGGYGLAQWTSSGRKANLYDMAKNSKKGIHDIDLQMDYLWSELNGGYKSSVLDPIRKTSSVEEASKIFLQKFEIPSGWDTQDKINERAGYAQQMYNLYANGEAGVDANGRHRGGRGRGAGNNVRSMNSKIAQINKLINDTRNEANTESVISEVTNRITDAVGKGTDSADDKMLKVIAETLAVMVEHLAAIRENTAHPATTTNVANRATFNRSGEMSQYPNGDDDAENVGKSIIDRLTSK